LGSSSPRREEAIAACRGAIAIDPTFVPAA
jgi:hypothetical protein